ncbi:hypothetical protein AAG906_027263 [Vitis piasezkii]
MRVLQSGFCWPSLFKDAHTMCKSCDRCQRVGKLTCRNMMPLNPILIHNDHKVVLKFLKENIFSRFGVPKAIISDGGGEHKEKIGAKLLDSLWAYRTAYKTILRMSLYRQVYGKACHLPIELEYKAWWAIKKLNMDLSRVGMKRFLDLNDLEEREMMPTSIQN